MTVIVITVTASVMTLFVIFNAILKFKSPSPSWKPALAAWVSVRAGLTFRGARGILLGRGPLPPPPPQPPNGILNPEFSKIKKYRFVFYALKIFLCIYKKRKNYTSII
jgi:hypothetical protein